MTTPQPRSWPEKLDALVAAPALHRGPLDNDRARVLEVIIEPEAHEPEDTQQAPHRTAAPGPLDWTTPAPHYTNADRAGARKRQNRARGLGGAIGSGSCRTGCGSCRGTRTTRLRRNRVSAGSSR